MQAIGKSSELEYFSGLELSTSSQMVQRKYDILQQEFTHLKVEHDELKKQYLQEKQKATSGNPFTSEAGAKD